MIIAEAGQNHLGNMGLAKDLIKLAHKNGADLCKFQLYDHNILYADHPEIPDAELSFEQAKMLFDYGESIGIEVFFSVFDLERVSWCEEIGVKRYKVAYNQRNNEELLLFIGLTGKPIIISSDEPTEYETLYCVSKYPASAGDFNLDKLYLFDGISDHTVGTSMARMVMSLWNKSVEKHFAIDHKTGVDAPWSMTPMELRELSKWNSTVLTCG